VEEKPSETEVEALKLKKTKRDQMPMDKLILFPVSGQREVLDSVRTYKLSESADWLAYQRGSKKDSMLYIRSLDGKMTDSIPAVSDFDFSKQGSVLYLVSSGDTIKTKPGIYTYQTNSQKYTFIKEGNGNFRKVQFDKGGGKLTFLYAPEAEKDSTDEKSKYALFMSLNADTAIKVADQGNDAIPQDWIITPQGDITFSENGEFLFFATSPEPRQRDTTTLVENRPDVQIWNWNESVQYTQQSVDRRKEARKAFTAVLHIPSGKINQLSTPDLSDLQIPANGSLALVSTAEPYGTERMWRGRSRQDIYIIDMKNGEKTPLLSGVESRVRISPAGKFGFWYNESDSSWFTCQLADKQIVRLTTPQSFPAWNEENDIPDYPDAYGAAGWTKDDEHLLLYDRNDIWQFNPLAKEEPVNLTVNGKTLNIRYQLNQLDKDVKYIDRAQPQLINGFNESTKESGFYSATLNKPSQPQRLLAGQFKASFLSKAKNSDAIIYTTETFSHYPEIRYSDLRFKKPVQLTSLGKQQEGIRWGTAELTSWISLDGTKLEGVIYKPVDFDPNKKYPLIVNFYERNAETFYSYRMPEPHRSTVDYHLYNSNGYIIFNPDIRYTEGYPGESCFNSVMPGIASLIAQGYIDEKAIAAQGHSWGGYQVAYLATRTNLFAAIESGAPVVNMFSAYGGIRWGTGLNRSFQYEHGQSRIGATPWETPLRYQENSPLFTMDKVTTPILIMHNDADGHVPWYQGIEYFVALKRLQKPVWMLNYTGEPHWPMKMANRVDFQKRMFQFFEHYLKGKDMPQWMSEGVKAVDQPFELGY